MEDNLSTLPEEIFNGILPRATAALERTMLAFTSSDYYHRFELEVGNPSLPSTPLDTF